MKGKTLKLISSLVNVPDFVIVKSTKDEIPFESDFYAVRSSAENEDTLEHSNAGLYLTKLFVKKEDLKNAISEVLENAGTCIVQKMIDSDMSGVIFTDKETRIFVAKGLCEGITSGKIFTEEYVAEKNDMKKVTSLFDFPPQGLFFEKNEFVLKDTDHVILSEEEKNELCKMIKILKKQFKEPLDIEFTFKDTVLYCLQCRPIAKQKEA